MYQAGDLKEPSCVNKLKVKLKLPVQQQVNDEPPPRCHPAGDLDSVTDTLGGFRGRGTLTHALMSLAHVSFRSRGKSAALFSIKSPKARKRTGSGCLFIFFFVSVRKSCNGRKSDGGEEERSTGWTGKFQFVLWQLWMWDGPRSCSNYLAGSFENSFLLRTEWPRLLCFSLRNWAKQSCKKERTWHSLLCLVWWTT